MSSPDRRFPLTWFLIVFGSLGVAIYALFGYTMFPVGSMVHPEMRAAYEAHSLGIYTHIFASLIALALGPFQFAQRLRRKNVSLHRLLGRVYLLGVLLGGISGLYLSRIAFGGLVSSVGFALLACIWLFSGFMALHHIRHQRVALHRRWMIRNFSLTFAAVTLRLYLGLFFAAGVSFETFYPLLAWICWVPNLVFVEWVLLARVDRE